MRKTSVFVGIDPRCTYFTGNDKIPHIFCLLECMLSIRDSGQSFYAVCHCQYLIFVSGVRNYLYNIHVSSHLPCEKPVFRFKSCLYRGLYYGHFI